MRAGGIMGRIVAVILPTISCPLAFLSGRVTHVFDVSPKVEPVFAGRRRARVCRPWRRRAEKRSNASGLASGRIAEESPRRQVRDAAATVRRAQGRRAVQ